MRRCPVHTHSPLMLMMYTKGWWCSMCKKLYPLREEKDAG